MRTRRLATAVLIAGGLALGATATAAPATAATASSASSASSATVSASDSARLAGGWYYAGNYKMRSFCANAGVRAVFNGALDFECRAAAGSSFDLYLLH
ncbi:hypothetical protein ACLQ2R_11345 [Streptosporangium sp. DT93]|uniref:hypothetical protein n=1 Tax=Streptosporangium sp. DT93 TaxID=3393428 RepID=UPI003CF89F2A